MGASSSSARLHRSTVKDVKDHLVYCLEEISKWEDGASLVHDLLLTDISCHPERLAAVGTPSEQLGDVSLRQYLQMSGGAGGAAFHHLLHSVDEVLRTGRGGEYFKNIPKERLERSLTHPASWYLLPPLGIERGKSSSRIFAVASLQSLLEQQESGQQTGGIFSGPTTTTSTPGGEPITYQKRLSEDVYGGVSTDEPPLHSSSKDAQPIGEVSRGGSGKFETQKEAEIRGFTPIGSHTHEATQEGESQQQQPSSIRSVRSNLPRERSESSVSGVTAESTSFETLENQRMTVAAKYLFIANFLAMLLQQAEFNYKAAVRLSTLKHQFKNTKQFNEMPQLQQLRVKRLAEENSARLERGIIGFDRARLALGWLMHNYALSAASFKVNAAIMQLHRIDRRIRSSPPSAAGLATSLRAAELAEISKIQSWMDQRHTQLLIEQQANERDSLSVGMFFLDASLSGYLEVSEVPDLSAKLFNLLDTKHKNRISHENLQECINHFCTRLDNMAARTQFLQHEIDSLPGSHTHDEASYLKEKNRDELQRIETDSTEFKWALRSIYTYFHDQFVRHVFPRISPSVHARDLSKVADTKYLISQLQHLEQESKWNALEREINLGRYESRAMKQAGIDAGVPSGKSEEIGGRTPKEALLGFARGKETQPEAKEEVHDVQDVQPTPYLERRPDETTKRQEEEKVPYEKEAGGFASLPTVTEKSEVPHAASTEEPVSRTFGEKVKETTHGIFSKEEASDANLEQQQQQQQQEVFREQPASRPSSPVPTKEEDEPIQTKDEPLMSKLADTFRQALS